MSLMYYSLQGELAKERFCEPVYESKGADSYNICRSGVEQARTEAQAQRYADYLIGGGTRDFKGWKRQQATTTLSGLAVTTLGALFGTGDDDRTTRQPSDAEELRRLAEADRKKSQKNIIIGVTVVAVLATVGVVLYKKYGANE